MLAGDGCMYPKIAERLTHVDEATKMTIVYGHFGYLLMEPISKTQFKAHALEVLRDIESTGKSRVITDRGRPTLEIRKLRQATVDPLDLLRGTVLKYEGATDPIADDDWESA